MHFSERVEHTYQTQLRIEELFSSIRSAVSAQRGYLLSGDTTYLNDYKRHRESTYAGWKRVDSLTADNPVQNKNLDTLHQLLTQRFDVLDNMLREYENSSVSGSRIFKGHIAESQDITRTMLAKFGDVRDQEKILMQERALVKAASERAAPALLLGFVIIALLLLSLSFMLLERELTRRLATQKELELKVEALNQTNNELEQFTYVASHDLQEPLRKIMTFGTMLKIKQKDRLDEEGNRLLDTITNLSQRMKNLIEDLLVFSRISNHNQSFVPVDLNQVVAQVWQDLSETVQQQQAILNCGKLPRMAAHPSQMHQLFQNLLANSLKYARSGVSPVIHISCVMTSGQEIDKRGDLLTDTTFHKIQIEDNGIGFEQQYAEQIFAIFQRLHTKETYSGTGVGLAICKRIVTNHGGYIQATASPGKGALFSIYLPATQ